MPKIQIQKIKRKECIKVLDKSAEQKERRSKDLNYRLYFCIWGIRQGRTLTYWHLTNVLCIISRLWKERKCTTTHSFGNNRDCLGSTHSATLSLARVMNLVKFHYAKTKTPIDDDDEMFDSFSFIIRFSCFERDWPNALICWNSSQLCLNQNRKSKKLHRMQKNKLVDKNENIREKCCRKYAVNLFAFIIYQFEMRVKKCAHIIEYLI